MHVYPELGEIPLETVETGDIESLVRSWAMSSSPETKTAASVRVIPVDDVVIEAVAAHLAAYPTNESGLVFRSAIGTPLRPSTLWMAWHKAASSVATDATPHDCGTTSPPC